MEAKTEAEQLKECREAFHALKETFNELLKEHQHLLKHSHSLGVRNLTLELERVENELTSRIAKIGHDPRITPLIERATTLEARMASIEASQQRNRATYRDIRDAQTRLEKAVSAKPPAHVPDEFDLQAGQRESQPEAIDFESSGG